MRLRSRQVIQDSTTLSRPTAAPLVEPVYARDLKGVKDNPNYRVCVRCVMDTTDPHIKFDEQGVCNHCRSYDKKVQQYMGPIETRKARLDKYVEDIKAAGKGKDYDCICGVSGGVDSTYVAYYAKKVLGLRPLAVHMDNGWNSELAVKNIEKTLRTLDIDLYTEVLDWDEFRDIQIAFLKASTPDSEIPTDHAIDAVLMQQASRLGIKYILGGHNVRSEAILPNAWSTGKRDWKYIRSLHKMFGTRPMKTFPHFSMFDMWKFLSVDKLKWINILDSVEYNKTEAMRVLQEDLGWIYYGGKHYESVYTRFFQGYILPVKFGYDKRKAHLSALVCAGEITREQALHTLDAEPTCPPDLLVQDMEFLLKKFNFSKEEFDAIMALPPKSIDDYPAYQNDWYADVVRNFYRAVKRKRVEG